MEGGGEDGVAGRATGMQRDGNVKRCSVVLDGTAVSPHVCQLGRGRALLEERNRPGLEIDANEVQQREQVRERQQQISAAAAEVDHNAAGNQILHEEHGRKVLDLGALAQAASVDRLLDGGVRRRVDGAANRNRASPPRHTVRVEPLRHRQPVDLHALVRWHLLVRVRGEGQPLMKSRERRVN